LRGMKWGRRRSAPTWVREKWAEQGTASGDAFLWRLGGAGAEEKVRGSGSVPRGGRRSGEGGVGVRWLWAAQTAAGGAHHTGAAGVL
jgi:hypothetical protein